MARELRTGSLNSARICSYGLPSTCAITFNRPRCAMPMNASRIPASAASVMTSSRIGTSMSRPSIEKRVFPGNERWMNFSNASTCVKRSSSASGSIGLCGARNRLVSMASRSQWRSSGTKMCAKSYPVVEQYSAPQPLHDLGHRPGPVRDGRTDERRRERGQVVIRHAMRGREQRGVADRPAAKRIDMRGQMPIAADRLREVDGADDNRQILWFRGVCFLTGAGPHPRASGPHRFAVRGVYCGLGRFRRRRPLAEECARRRVNGLRIALELLVELQHVGRVHALKVTPIE